MVLIKVRGRIVVCVSRGSLFIPDGGGKKKYPRPRPARIVEPRKLETVQI